MRFKNLVFAFIASIVCTSSKSGSLGQFQKTQFEGYMATEQHQNYVVSSLRV